VPEPVDDDVAARSVFTLTFTPIWVYHYKPSMEDTIASTFSEAISWVASATASALDGAETDQVDVPVLPPPLGDDIGPDNSEGSYFLVSWREHVVVHLERADI
jgi:hypothetical protein